MEHRICQCLADELRGVKLAHGSAAFGPGQRWNMPDIWLIDHRAHRRVDVLGLELARDVLVEYSTQIESTAHLAPPVRRSRRNATRILHPGLTGFHVCARLAGLRPRRSGLD